MTSGTHRVRDVARIVRVAVWLASAGLAPHAPASVLYEEDFSSVAEWFPVYNQNGGTATVTSDGDHASFYVQGANNVVAFAPVFPFVNVHELNPDSSYMMRFGVVSVSYSTSYSIEIDQFDSNSNYVTTVFNVWPEGTSTGTNTFSLANLYIHPSATYILPKITMRTGDGDQTIVFDSLDIYPVPEPTNILMLGLGALLLRKLRTRALQSRTRRA